MLKSFFTLLFLSAALFSQAQTKLPRFLLDVPAMYATAPDVVNIKSNVGLGLEVALNVATHWATARVGGGSNFTLNPQAEKVGDSFLATPFAQFELGIGQYRTNGNQCAKQHSNAFTAMAVASMRYNIDARSVKPANEENSPYGFQFGAGAEFGYFFISDILRNTEVFLRGTYYPTPKTASVNFGFKFFLNLRAFGY